MSFYLSTSVTYSLLMKLEMEDFVSIFIDYQKVSLIQTSMQIVCFKELT